MKTALLIVDLQRDFCRGGTLAVEGGDKVVEPANRLIHCFEEHAWPIFFTRDWHPVNHCSFKVNSGPWPPHCIAGTPGAAFHADLHIPAGAPILSKANEPDKEAYSGFEGTNLDDLLKKRSIESVIIAGLTTDYCVKTTALDAHRFGFKVTVAIDAIRAVNAKPEDGRCAIKHMQVRGVRFEEADDIIRQLQSK